MVLLIDPYANRTWSMSDVRVLNKVADALACAHEDLDPEILSGAITRAYRSGMNPQALMMHVTRELQGTRGT